MALTYGFFNSINHDRTYSAEQVSALFDGLIHDGVFDSIGDIFATVPGEGLQVLVKSGKAWFNHTWTINDTPMPLSIPTPDVLLSRIDAVVLEVNSTESVRANSIKLKTGTPSSTPAKPEMLSTENVHQYPLAYVTVAAGVTAITVSDIEINVGKSSCPFVTGIIQSTDIDDLFNQWEGEFDTWFENLKTQLSDDVVANLQGQIDRKLDKADKATTEMIQAGTDDTHYITPKGMKEGSAIQIEGAESLKMKLVYDSVTIDETNKISETALSSNRTVGFIYDGWGYKYGTRALTETKAAALVMPIHRYNRKTGASEKIIDIYLAPKTASSVYKTGKISDGVSGHGKYPGFYIPYTGSYVVGQDGEGSSILSDIYGVAVVSIDEEGVHSQVYSQRTSISYPGGGRTHFSKDYVVMMISDGTRLDIHTFATKKQKRKLNINLLPYDKNNYAYTGLGIKNNIFYYLYSRTATPKILYVGGYNLETDVNSPTIAVMDFSSESATFNSMRLAYDNEVFAYIQVSTSPSSFVRFNWGTLTLTPTVLGSNENGAFYYFSSLNGVPYFIIEHAGGIGVFKIENDEMISVFFQTEALPSGSSATFKTGRIEDQEFVQGEQKNILLSPNANVIVDLDAKKVSALYVQNSVMGHKSGASYDTEWFRTYRILSILETIRHLETFDQSDFMVFSDPGASDIPNFRLCTGIESVDYVGKFS